MSNYDKFKYHVIMITTIFNLFIILILLKNIFVIFIHSYNINKS